MDHATPSDDKPPYRLILQLGLPAILLALACLLPYLNKAYTIDDPWFLLEARQILKTPLQPMSYPICWMDDYKCYQRASSLGPGTGQSLTGYLLVPVILLGGAEWVAHSIELILLILAILSMVGLSLRLGFSRNQAMISGLLLIAIPPVLSMASTAMPDIPAMALSLAGIERLMAWKTGRRAGQAIAAALLLGLAPYARLHVFLLLPLAGLMLIDDFTPARLFRKLRDDALLFAPLLAAVCILAAINFITRDRTPTAEKADLLIRATHGSGIGCA